MAKVEAGATMHFTIEDTDSRPQKSPEHNVEKMSYFHPPHPGNEKVMSISHKASIVDTRLPETYLGETERSLPVGEKPRKTSPKYLKKGRRQAAISLRDVRRNIPGGWLGSGSCAEPPARREQRFEQSTGPA